MYSLLLWRQYLVLLLQAQFFSLGDGVWCCVSYLGVGRDGDPLQRYQQDPRVLHQKAPLSVFIFRW